MFHVLMLDFVTVNGNWRDKESNLGNDCVSGYRLPCYPKEKIMVGVETWISEHYLYLLNNKQIIYQLCYPNIWTIIVSLQSLHIVLFAIMRIISSTYFLIRVVVLALSNDWKWHCRNICSIHNCLTKLLWIELYKKYEINKKHIWKC